MILDGFGLAAPTNGNAIHLANTPHLDWLMEKYPCVEGQASGLAVGLPEGQMGNSEVGHTNIGAGRVVYQELTRISKDINDGIFFKNKALIDAINHAIKHNSDLHLYGLLSDGGVHSHNTHLYALLELAKQKGLSRVYVHVFLDGRDTPPTSGLGYIKELEEKMQEIGIGQIATISGRYYAMDRDKRWDRVKLAYDCMVMGEGKTAPNATACMEDSYKESVNDEFVIPTKISDITIKENDAIIFYNFRPDRAREISRSLCDPDFKEFDRPKGYFKLHYVCFTEYDTTIPNKHIAFTAQSMDNVLGEYLSKQGKTQLRLAETEKYAHVTFFFNGGNEEPYKGEDRILVPSKKVATYDLQPEMSAVEVTDKLVEAIESEKYDLIVINYANCDMVGHTGDMNAAIKAVETVDTCVARTMKTMMETGTRMFFCADHGNADQMLDPDNGVVFTAHSTNPVPFVLFNCDKNMTLKTGGRLCDIAPTLLELLGLKQPSEMTGESLLNG